MARPNGKTQLATLFRNGGSQAVRLPREFQFAGDRVRVRRIGRGVLLEPVVTDPQDWFAALDTFDAQPFMPEGRSQPKTPRRKIFR
jgi:antitoxin VapB